MRIAACSLLALLAAPALAQQAPASNVINDQLQWGDVFATMNVVVTGPAGPVSSSALAAGNSATAANTTGALNMRSTQTFSGAAFATATIQAGDVAEAAVAVASAQGSALEAQTIGGALDLDANQIADGGDAQAIARANVGNTPLLSVAANAAANNAVAGAVNGPLRARLTQNAQNSVYAVADSDACCAGAAVVGASAAVNALSTISETSTVSADYTQISTGREAYASADHVQQRGTNATIASSAAANSATVENKWGYSSIRGRQTSTTNARAETRATLFSWEGTAAASSYAVGNATLATNVGSDLAVDIGQLNTGGVDAETVLIGANGGDAIANATALGNATTAYVCSECGDARVSGTITQVNGGTTTATGSVTTTASGAVFGTASAVGNTATFITSQRQP